MADITQVRKLFQRIQHPQLQDTVKVVEVRAELDGTPYSETANHFTAVVSNMPEYQLSQNFAGFQASGGKSDVGSPRKGVRNSGSIYNSQVNVHTGCCQKWKGLS